MFVLYIVGGFIFIGVVIIFCVYYSKTMKMTSYMDGEVVRSEDRVVRDEHERREETLLVCKYSVRGTEYQIEHTIRGNHSKIYPPGKKIVVWYNPTSPHMARIKD